ncbi:M14-type cytosolic carboxypeptidase [Bacteroidota bacterium]
MKYISYLSVFCFSFLISCSSPPEVKFSTDFDRGSIGDMEKISDNLYRGKTNHWLKRDGIGDQYYWFYFKAENVKGRSVTFELSDLIGVYRGDSHLVFTDYTQPVFSYDEENWERIQDVKYDSASHTFWFTQQFINEPVWIAYAHPYPNKRLSSVIEEIKDSEYIQIKNLAKTKEDRDLTMVKISETAISDVNKKNILIMALQHSGEDAGGFMAEGMIDFLISDDPDAKTARENFNYFIVPIMNPDGIYNGTSRYNMEMEDLNNIWLDDEKAQPEVAGVKKWVDSWYEDGMEIDLFIDIHNHSQFHQYNVFISQDHSLDSLVTVMDKYWPTRIWHSEFKGSSCAWFFRKEIQCTTIELSQSHLADGQYLTIEDYFNFGKGTVIALNEYYNSN